jgi:molybdopterin-guanine dinucleotide biosynthesis protein A
MGRDKRFLPIGGTFLLDWVLGRLRPLVAEVIVVTQDPAPLNGLDARVVTDRFPGMGVLAGVQAGLAAARHPWALVVAGDMPLLNRDLLRAMIVRAKPASCDDALCDAIIPRWRSMLEPLHALYRTRTCAPAAEAALRRGDHRIVAFYPDIEICEMEKEVIQRWDPEGASFFNVNTPEDWATALSRAHPAR